jgi:hypothetical protein
MQEQTTSSRLPEKLARPSRFALLIHLVKTAKLILALLKDKRIPFARKLLFFGSLFLIVLLLLFPDTELVLGVILPVIGAILGVPLDIGFDWVVLSLVLVSLLRVFPAELVSEHYQGIFHKL